MVTVMPFKGKPYIKVGKPKNVFIPRPPKFATHARMACTDPLTYQDTPKVAILPIQDFDCFRGVTGDFSYVRMDKKRKITQEYEGTWYWDGFRVPEIQGMINE